MATGKNQPGEETLEAIWCTDSESSERYLLDLRTGKIIARQDKHGIILAPEN